LIRNESVELLWYDCICRQSIWPILGWFQHWLSS